MSTWGGNGRHLLPPYIKMEYAVLPIKLLVLFLLFSQALLDMP